MVLILVYSIKWILNQVIRCIRVLIRYITEDFFKLFNLISISLSLTLIGTWFSIIMDSSFRIDSAGLIDSDRNGTNYIDSISNLAN